MHECVDLHLEEQSWRLRRCHVAVPEVVAGRWMIYRHSSGHPRGDPGRAEIVRLTSAGSEGRYVGILQLVLDDASNAYQVKILLCPIQLNEVALVRTALHPLA